MNKVKIPAEVLNALRFYANGEHFNIDGDAQEFDTVSGEPGNWLHSQRDEDCTMIEDGGIARAVLQGKKIDEEAESIPVSDEIFSAAPTPPDHEKEILKVIDERDQYHEWADKLADAIAERLGVDIGEHSNLNSPWENALEFIEATPPEVEPVGFVSAGGLKKLGDKYADGQSIFPNKGVIYSEPVYASPPPADDERKSVGASDGCGTRVAEYRTPADDELRKVAEEALLLLSSPEKINNLGQYLAEMITVRDNLRAALNKGKS
jgi:hypothetical protein